MLTDIDSMFETDTAVVRENMIKNYVEVTGRSLAAADPVRLFLYSVADEVVQLRILMKNGLKQNLLYYAQGTYLDHIGYLMDCPRLMASKAVTRLKISLSAPINKDIVVPKGTRVSSEDGCVFSTDEDIIIGAWDVEAEVDATADNVGMKYNGYVAGMVKNVIDPVAYVQSIVNITTTDGGSDIETDDAYRIRIHEAPESFSTAGSANGYRYFVMKYNSLISDVAVTSPAPGEVLIQPLLQNGEIPSDTLLGEILDVINADDVRPLTDHVTVDRPYTKDYNIDLTYYIDNDDRPQALNIKLKIEKAIDDFIKWQCGRLGRDINASRLTQMIVGAGAKFVDVREPLGRIIVEPQEVAQLVNMNIVYGGTEDG